MSQIGWVDFSPKDRGLVKTALAMLNEPGTLDELGIGQIRDGFSDLLFPGMSTIQTRAKYFITVPRILRDYQLLNSAGKRRPDAFKFLSDSENEVAKALVNFHDENEGGIIGRTRVNSGGVSRRPSAIYWNGLRTLGLVKTSLSLADFCRHLDGSTRYNTDEAAMLDEGGDDTTKEINLVELANDDPDWMSEEVLNIALTHKEATLLHSCFIESPVIANSVPAQLLKHGLLLDLLDNDCKLVGNNKQVESFDLLVESLCAGEKVDTPCKSTIKLAQEFSLAMEGAHIRYNIVLAEKHEYRDSVERYKLRYQEWFKKIQGLELFQSDCEEAWLEEVSSAGRAINEKPRTFIKNWCSLMRNNNATDQELDECVKEQAIKNKGGRSLLKKGLIKDQWMGMDRLDYRWSTAKGILHDIQEGLNAKT